MEYNRLTIENVAVLKLKAKSKKDGCYQLRGIGYRVFDNSITHYACRGDILENAGNFVVTVGHYDSQWDVSPAKILKDLK